MPYRTGRDGTLVLESVPDLREAATILFDEKSRTSHVESEPSAHLMHCMHLGAVSTGMVLKELVQFCSQWNIGMLVCLQNALKEFFGFMLHLNASVLEKACKLPSAHAMKTLCRI